MVKEVKMREHLTTNILTNDFWWNLIGFPCKEGFVKRIITNLYAKNKKISNIYMFS
jgi:hypothetical protein